MSHRGATPLRPEVRFRRIAPLRRFYARWRQLPDLVALQRRGLVLATDVHLQSGVYLDERHPELISIGENTGLSVRVTVLAHEPGEGHGGVRVAPVRIGSKVFIGAGATIRPGTTIGDGCVVGAGSVVVGDVPAGSVVAGNPARVVAQTAAFVAEHERRRADAPTDYAR